MNNLLKREIIMQYKHIIFDLDGTLIDTEEAILKTWQKYFRRIWLPVYIR